MCITKLINITNCSQFQEVSIDAQASTTWDVNFDNDDRCTSGGAPDTYVRHYSYQQAL